MTRVLRSAIVFLAVLSAAPSLYAQQSLARIRMQDDFGHVMLLQGPVGGFGTNWTLRFPSHSDTLGAMLFESDNNGQLAWLTPGANNQVLTIVGGIPTWSTPSSGTVLSVGLSMPSGFVVSNSPVTSSGTLAVSTTLNGVLHGNGSGFTAGSVNLATEVSGILPAASGGTGINTSATPTGSILYTSAAGTWATLPAGSNTQVLTLTGGVPTWAPATNAGTVTSIGMSVPSFLSVSPSSISTSGTFAISLASESANTVFAAPNGSAGAPTFRTLVAADIPSLSATDWVLAGNAPTAAYNGTTGNFLGTTNTQPLVLATTNTTTAQPIEFFTNNAEKMRLTSAGELGIGLTPTSGKLLHVTGTGGTANVRLASLSSAMAASTGGVIFADANGDLNRLAAPASNGQVLTSTTGGALTWTTPSGSGTVTSIGMTVPSILSVSPSSITTNGTFALSLASQSANTIFAGPTTGAAAAPTFRSLVAADINGVAWTTSGNSGTSPWNGSTGNFLGTTDAQSLSIATTNTTAQDIKFFTGASGANERVRITGTTGRVGVNTGTPNVKMDVNGGFAIRAVTLSSLSNGNNNNVAIGDSSNYRISGPTANFTITGLTGGSDGKQLMLFNTTSKAMTLAHLSSSSSAANRIFNPAKSDMQIADSGMVSLVYDAGMGYWVVQSNSGAVNGVSTRLLVRKNGDQDDNTGGALIDDNDLKFTAAPNTWYQIECMLIDSGTSTGAIAMAGLSMPSGADAEMIVFGGADGNQQQDINMLRLGTVATGNGTQVNIASIRGFVRFTGAIITGSTGGTVTIRWGANKAGKTMRVFKESYLVIQSAIKL